MNKKMDAKYSIILYYTEIMEAELIEIDKMLQIGITIYLFLSGDFKEELSLNEWEINEVWQSAIDNKFLNVYNNLQGSDYEEGVIAIDDKVINSNFYEAVCKNNYEITGRYDKANENQVSGNFYRHSAVRDFYVVVKSLLVWQDNGVNYSLIESPYIKEFVDKEKVLDSIKEDRKALESYLEEQLQASGFKSFRENVQEENPLILLQEIVMAQKPWENIIASKYEVYEYEANLNHLLFILNDTFREETVSLIELEEFLRIKITTDKLVVAKKACSTDIINRQIKGDFNE